MHMWDCNTIRVELLDKKKPMICSQSPKKSINIEKFSLENKVHVYIIRWLDILLLIC